MTTRPGGTTPAERPAMAAWTDQLGSPQPEAARSRHLAHLGGLSSIAVVIGYLIWRITSTLPHGTANLVAAWVLLSFEALSLVGLVVKTVALWNIDAPAPPAVYEAPAKGRLVVLIPTYNEPADVIAPTVAAACDLQPAHETWVLDDGTRGWVKEMAEAFGARYVSREVHDHAKAGNINNALRIMAEERPESCNDDILAVLDCDHVPLPAFLTSTLGWFADRDVAIVQCPQEFYNKGAFDDDGYTGEQGLFFNVLLPARHHADAGPFWCGSTSVLRARALRSVGGVATETVVEDMHTTLKLIRLGWRTVYHHQTVAVGLAPDTSEQYLIQRRRWGMGAMQVMRHERLWSAKRWLSWRNFYEYLSGTLWWLEGVATLGVFAIPMAILLSGFQTSTARPLTFCAVFVAAFGVRLWGAKRLLRGHIHWPTAFALRVFRVPIGLSCAWWLMSRRSLEFQVTPKGGEQTRYRGRAPRILWWLLGTLAVVCGYAAAGVAHLVPWRNTLPSTLASGAWLVLAGGVLVCGLRRIRSNRYLTSRRDAPRIPVRVPVEVDWTDAELVDVSVGGASVRLPAWMDRPSGLVALTLPGDLTVKMEVVPAVVRIGGDEVVSLRLADGDWESRRRLSLWLFHTPDGVVPGLDPGVPVAGVISSPRPAPIELPGPVTASGSELPCVAPGGAEVPERLELLFPGGMSLPVPAFPVPASARPATAGVAAPGLEALDGGDWALRRNLLLWLFQPPPGRPRTMRTAMPAPFAPEDASTAAAMARLCADAVRCIDDIYRTASSDRLDDAELDALFAALDLPYDDAAPGEHRDRADSDTFFPSAGRGRRPRPARCRPLPERRLAGGVGQ